MDLQLKGKVALITGSSRGIGLAVALGLAREGARVMINGVDKSRLEAATHQFRCEGLEAAFCPAQVCREEQVAHLFKETLNCYGRLDILVNNAGIFVHDVPFYKLSEEIFDDVIRVNLKGVFLCSRRAARTMIEQAEGGIILNAASFTAKIPSWGTSIYGATKAAIFNLTRTMAAELAPYGIRVNSYMPGVVATDMTAAVMDDRSSSLKKSIALNRIASPEELAPPVVFLCSPLSSYITGANLELSGGKFTVQNPEYAWSLAISR
jgi:3-oxoacyl-[acyl-carrier protein] reductase